MSTADTDPREVPADPEAEVGSDGAAVSDASEASNASDQTPAGPRSRLRRYATHPASRHIGLLLGYLALGVVVTWPRASYLTGRMPNTRDQGSYAWDLWWIAHQLVHLGNPFHTTTIYAPVGTPLAYNSMMPLLGVIAAPITLTAGAAFSANLLSIMVPGLASYAMYRAARLWLPAGGAFVAGALFGLSTMLDWRAYFHLNLAAGAAFLPVTLELAVRLRRAPSLWRAVWLGLTVGLCLLVDSESTILCAIVVAVVLLPWLLKRGGTGRKIGQLALAVGVALVVASLQIVAMLRQTYVLKQNPAQVASNFKRFGVSLTQIFAPSPRVSAFGLDGLGNYYFHGIVSEGMPTFGVTLTALALFGAVVMWRRRPARSWLVLWLVGAVLALGPVIYIGRRAYAPLAFDDHGQKLSALMPYTWFTRLPGMSGFYEANRFTVLALMPAALLAGGAVVWIGRHAKPAVAVVAVLALLELGWSGPKFGGGVPHLSLSTSTPAGSTMDTHSDAIDAAIKADHSKSLVVDVPLGFRSGTLEYGAPFEAEGLVLGTVDEHPRAVGYVARLPQATVDKLSRHRFYTGMLKAQSGRRPTRAEVRQARADARRMNVGWVVVWQPVTPVLSRFLAATGFHLENQAGAVTVFRRGA